MLLCQFSIQKNFLFFGLDRKNIIPKPFNIILLYAKYYVYITRCNQHTLSFDIYKKKLLLLYKTLKEIALSNNELTDFYEDWNPYEPLLSNMI